MSKLYRQKLLTDKLVFLDGVSRAGKFMLSKIFSNFQDVEAVSYEPTLELLPAMSSTGLIDQDFVGAYCIGQINMFIYERIIGRGLNFRTSDSSSLSYAADPEQYTLRMSGPEGQAAVDKFPLDRRSFPFLIHQCLRFYEQFLALGEGVRFLNIQRHPIDLAHSWHKRDWGTRMGHDPLAFEPTIDDHGRPRPWYIPEDAGYFEMQPAERVVVTIRDFVETDLKTIRAMTPAQRAKFLVVFYEDFFGDVEKPLSQIEKFFKIKRAANMAAVLEREGCHKPLVPTDRVRKLAELESLIRPELAKELRRISADYEEFYRKTTEENL